MSRRGPDDDIQEYLEEDSPRSSFDNSDAFDEDEGQVFTEEQLDAALAEQRRFINLTHPHLPPTPPPQYRLRDPVPHGESERDRRARATADKRRRRARYEVSAALADHGVHPEAQLTLEELLQEYEAVVGRPWGSALRRSPSVQVVDSSPSPVAPLPSTSRRRTRRRHRRSPSVHAMELLLEKEERSILPRRRYINLSGEETEEDEDGIDDEVVPDTEEGEYGGTMEEIGEGDEYAGTTEEIEDDEYAGTTEEIDEVEGGGTADATEEGELLFPWQEEGYIGGQPLSFGEYTDTDSQATQSYRWSASPTQAWDDDHKGDKNTPKRKRTADAHGQRSSTDDGNHHEFEVVDISVVGPVVRYTAMNDQRAIQASRSTGVVEICGNGHRLASVILGGPLVQLVVDAGALSDNGVVYSGADTIDIFIMDTRALSFDEMIPLDTTLPRDSKIGSLVIRLTRTQFERHAAHYGSMTMKLPFVNTSLTFAVFCDMDYECELDVVADSVVVQSLRGFGIPTLNENMVNYGIA